jgi:hypothetical protein
MSNNEEIKNLYFSWMASLAIVSPTERSDYSHLLNALYDTKFYFTIPLDENRYVDGLDLRYRFGYSHNISKEQIMDTLDTRECSMLEMMVALALRCEEHIMYDPDLENQLSNWFSDMLQSLKLENMTNNNFDIDWVTYRLDCLLKHEYEPNGSGGLFTIRNPRQDLRKVEIWYQMCWYLDTILNSNK